MNPIVILHGWGSCAKNWSRVKELLEGRGYKVFVPDLPGFGKNPSPKNPWSIDDYVEWVKDFVEKNNLDHFFILGHSFGGGLAVKLVNLFPEKVMGLILVAAKVRRQKTLRYYFGLTLGKIGKLVFSFPILSFLQPLARKFLYLIVGTRDYYKLELEKAVVMKETFKEIVKADLTPYLPKIRVPTLIIWGKEDKVTPLKDAYLINKEIKGSKLEIIEGGHVPSLERLEVLAQKILNFLQPGDSHPIKSIKIVPKTKFIRKFIQD